MITSERCEDIGSWLSENAQKETPEYTSTMAVRLYALTHSFSRRFGPRAPLNVAICRAALRWVAIRRDASRSDALCTGLRLRLRMAIRRYVAIRRDMWRCHALCVPYVSSTSLPEDCETFLFSKRPRGKKPVLKRAPFQRDKPGKSASPARRSCESERARARGIYMWA